MKLSLPPTARVVGELWDDYTEAPELLDEDILLVSLPNGIAIDVGWTPSFDPRGNFKITVFRGEWGNNLQQPIVETHPQTVASLVSGLAWYYRQLRPVGSVSNTESFNTVSGRRPAGYNQLLIPA